MTNNFRGQLSPFTSTKHHCILARQSTWILSNTLLFGVRIVVDASGWIELAPFFWALQNTKIGLSSKPHCYVEFLQLPRFFQPRVCPALACTARVCKIFSNGLIPDEHQVNFSGHFLSIRRASRLHKPQSRKTKVVGAGRVQLYAHPKMRLIHTSTLEIQEFTRQFPSNNLPKYGILSHTWGDDEVTFQDMKAGPLPIQKRGYGKIKETCRLARGDGLDFAWVDTCCIDKSSSAELTEAINSMYAWYRDSEVCYAFLEDLEPDTEINSSSKFRECRWFTRGWTLQELIAPKRVEFYDRTWAHRGLRDDIATTLQGITLIPAGIFTGQQKLSATSVSQRMSWASLRRTTRIEDEAYCLLGIFSIYMPLIYGEGLKSFRRLQEEIIKSTGDLSILAWQATHPGRPDRLLAVGTASFFVGPGIIYSIPTSLPDMTITTRGLRISGNTWMHLSTHGTTYYLLVGTYIQWTGHVVMQAEEPPVWISALQLSKIGPGLFLRRGFEAQLPPERELPRHYQSEYYLLTEIPSQINELYLGYREQSLHVANNELFHVEDAVPHSLWDVTDKIFFRENTWTAEIHYTMALGVKFQGCGDFSTVKLVVLLDLSSDSPDFRIFQPSQAPRLLSRLFNARNMENSMIWADLDHLDDVGTDLGGSVVVQTGAGPKRITPVLTENTLVPSDGGDGFPVHSLRLQVENSDDRSDLWLDRCAA